MDPRATPAAPLGDSNDGTVLGEATVDLWLGHAEELLLAEDPVAALDVFRRVHAAVPVRSVRTLVGTGACHLLLGRSGIALAYADAVLRRKPDHAGAISLRIRALLRGRRFTQALEEARAGVELIAGRPESEPLAALGSALFRNRRNDEAAEVYARVLEIDPDHAEAHLRLGSGLTSPRAVVVGERLRKAAEACRQGRLGEASRQLRAVIQDDNSHPVAHRLLGEVLYAQRAGDGLVGRSPEFAALRAALPNPRVNEELLAVFLPDYADLMPARQLAVRRAVAPFRSRLRKLLTLRARHDLLGRLERTTDEASRASLRGKRTFDGRVWDDVRGIGGLRAATGIEALDEALLQGFDTLAHEVAHQAHFYGLNRRMRMRISRLFEHAQKEGLFLDYYAASNDAEYFAQGVEAFVCYGKRPTREATHGHTRFELMRRDPELHELIDTVVDFDPLDDPAIAPALLDAAFDVALRCGRALDARTAARLMVASPERTAKLERARVACLESRTL